MSGNQTGQLRDEASGRGLDGLRRLSSILLVIVAALASIATSPEDPTVSVRVDGPRFELSPDQPEMTVEVEVVPTPEAESAPDKRVHLRATPVWTNGNETSGSLPRPAEFLETVALDREGRVMATGRESFLCDHPCGDLAAVRFRLLESAPERLIVNWTVEPSFTWESEDDVPREAELAVEFGPVSDGTSDVVADARLDADRDSRYDFGATRIQIHAPEGVTAEPGIRFEPLRAREGSVLHGPVETHPIEHRKSITVEAPDRCRPGTSCDWSLLLVGDGLEWQLVAPPELELVVGLDKVTPVELASEVVTGEPLRLGPGEEGAISLALSVESSYYEGRDFEVVGPVVAVEFRLAWDDPDASLSFGDSGVAALRDGSIRVGAIQLAPSCRADSCVAWFDLPVSFRDQAEGVVEWEVQAFIPFLWSGSIPEDGRIELQAES